MNLTSVVIGYTIESVVWVAIGGAMNVAGVYYFPFRVAGWEPVILTLIIGYVLAHMWLVIATLRGSTVPSPRLPNLAQTARRMAFPEPPTHRARRTAYSARQRRMVQP